MGFQRSVYIGDDDVELWERAAQYARDHRMKISGVVLLALERLLNEEQDS